MIEFKSYNVAHGTVEKSLEGIKKGITAMLNSSGGIIIWGAPEGKQVAGKKEKVFSGVLSPVSELIEKDKLINKISSAITPLPVGVNVKILQDGASYVYLFEVQKSAYSPHQLNNLYYARLDGQSQPAPHYLIEALFRKISYPDLRGYLKLTNISHDGHNHYLDIAIYIFNVSELQNEEDVSFRLMCDNGIFVNSRNPALRHMYGFEGHQLIYKGLINVLHFGAPNEHIERIALDAAQLPRFGSKLNLYLNFGGRKSPLKSSDYVLDLRRIDFNNVANPNYLIESMSENILASEERVKAGLTIEAQIASVVGR